MVALDSNVVLRYLIADDPVQHQRAKRVIDSAAEQGDELFLSDIVLAEIAWTLRSHFKILRQTILATLIGLTEASQMRFESRDRVLRALRRSALGKGEFADYMIRERTFEQGCEAVITFDRALLREDGFIAP